MQLQAIMKRVYSVLVLSACNDVGMACSRFGEGFWVQVLGA